MKAVVLVSGGMDSCTVATYAKLTYSEVRAVSFAYGAKHEEAELRAAREVCRALQLEHQTVDLPRLFNGSALTNGGSLPLGREFAGMRGVAPSYVPARNSVFLSLAAAVADAWGASVVCYGAHREDHMGYPDCRPEFVEAMSAALTCGTKHSVRVDAPFIRVSKADIVRAAVELDAPLALTHSCYQGLAPACGLCDTCYIRIDAFRTAGYVDPIRYATAVDWGNCTPLPAAIRHRRADANGVT
jgi:7-cyano-7-deazaguanine synthase